MRIARRRLLLGAAALGFTGFCSTGCQTYPAGFGGMTLPSPHYLKHYPQLFPPDPDFPLQRELDSQMDPENQLRRSGGASVPGVGGPGPAPGAVSSPAPAGR